MAYIHEIAGPIWQVEFPFPVAVIGPLIEKLYLTLYRSIHFLTDSSSTKQELSKNGVLRINIIELTIESPLKIKINKSVNPTLVYVGRLGAVKRLEILIQTASLLIKKIPDLTVIIAGKGKKGYLKFLHKSWLLVHPSLKEGFGLNVLEAASQKTPTVCFNKVSGLQDIVINNRNGVIVNSQTPQALAEDIFALIKDRPKLKRLADSTYHWWRNLPTWKQQTKKLEKLLFRSVVSG